MKRLLAFLFCMTLTLFAIPQEKVEIFDNENISKVVVVSKQELNQTEFLNVEKCGDLYFYCTDDILLAKSVKDFDGIVLYFQNCTPQQIFQQYDSQYFCGSQVDGYDVFYGYTNMFSKYVSVKNKRVNIQLVQKDDCVIAGFPMILTGF